VPIELLHLLADSGSVLRQKRFTKDGKKSLPVDEAVPTMIARRVSSAEWRWVTSKTNQ
jgi:hypothetical protein